MRRVYTILYIVAAVLFTGCGADLAMKKGDKFYALGEYYDAAAQYKKAYTKTPAKDKKSRGERALKMGDCYRRINYTAKAIAAYNNAVRYHQTDSMTQIYLAQLQLKSGSYREAERILVQVEDTVLATLPAEMIDLHNALLESARMAPGWKAEGSKYTVKREDIFNSRRADFSPMLCGDNHDQLFFTSTRNQAKGDELSGITGTKYADIFFSQKDDKGKWSRPETIDSELNSDFDDGVCSFSPDNRTMYLTQCKTDPDYPRYAKICTSQRSDASWGKATELEITHDTLSTFAHPAISPDGLWLYFVSDMPGGMGGYDIWRAELTTAGVGALENIGAPVNTAGDEMFPTFRPNGDLYFSSNGHSGLGGLDIFIAKPTPNSSQRERELYRSVTDSIAETNPASVPLGGVGGGYTIEHPGFPLNSQGDDFGMTFEGLRNRGYFSSNRGDARGWDHIYSFEKSEVVQTVKGWVYEQEGYELPQGLVYMVGDDGTNLRLNVKGDGSFEQEIQPGVNYVFLGTCKGFLNHKEELHVEAVTESEEYTLQFPLANISAPVLIENIFYDFDKATLRPESETALNELVDLLNENPNVTIELSAHTDYKGSAEYNERLSQRRAESVVNYLIAHGIAADRLTPKGYGKEKPKTVRRKLTEKYPWLKEGDILTEEFVKALRDEQQQEECNQLNRRTEFMVLRTTYGLFDEKGQIKNPPKPKQQVESHSTDDDWF
jgi:outer membrane protein OmpA-like peptidoglycan-associated protein